MKIMDVENLPAFIIQHPGSEANGNGQHVATSKAAFQEIPSAAGLNCTWKSSVLAQDRMGMFAVACRCL